MQENFPKKFHNTEHFWGAQKVVVLKVRVKLAEFS